MADYESGLLGGFDPRALQAIVAQFAPTEDEKKRARLESILAGGLAFMGARKGDELQQFGRSGLLAMGNYRQNLKDTTAERGSSITQALNAMKMSKDMQFSNLGLQMMGGQSQAPSQEMGPPSPGQAGPPTGANPELGFALAGKKDVADVLHRQNAITTGPDGTMTRNGVIIGRALQQGILLFQNGDQNKAQFYPNPQEAMEAVAKQAGAVKGAEKAAEFPYHTSKAVNAQGQPVEGYTSSLFGQPGQPPKFNGTMSPADVNRALQDNSGQKPFERNDQQGVLVGPNPVQLKQAEGKVASAQAQDTEISKGFGSDYLGVIKAEMQAPKNIAQYTQLKDFLGRVDSGKLAPSVLALKSIASYVAPDLAKEWTKDVPYGQAATALANEMALQLRNPQGGAGMPGALSDSDLAFLRSMTASSSNDPRAIPLMLDARIAVEQRSKDMGKLARDYRTKNGQIDEGFFQQASQFAETHPLFQAQPQAQPAGPAVQPSLQSAVDEMRRRGLIK